ncbi:MAG TPA: DNA topoisomerase I [Candidatus Nanoarchaeia archaeon]|nr:DNA topoisomerase I [Candidatus Nanoarchaeia archaeon]
MQRLEKYTLIITEKPDAASRIAEALGNNGEARKFTENGVPYYEAHRDKKLIVVPALGHLYTVAAKKKKPLENPILDYAWVPRYEAERNASRIKTWLQVIAKLGEEADSFIDACDYDIEGSIIGYCILKYTCGNRENEAKRMKYSTLTKEELEKSYDELMPQLDFNLINAGLARHEVDWLYGINLSRALTAAAKKAGNQYITLSTGRVQGPTLKFLALRERNIASFVPNPYWTLKAKIDFGDNVLEANHERIFEVEAEAKATATHCKSRNGKITRIEKRQFRQNPPFPFDLSSLQVEAYRLFKIAPKQTSSAAQKLYLDALISYPRTSSQKLPAQIGYQKILKNLAKIREYTLLAGELLAKDHLKPNEGKKTDSAHPAIYPTGKKPAKPLVGAEKSIYDLVVRRFLSTFGDSALRQTSKVILEIGGQNFTLSGMQTLKQGWLQFYGSLGILRENPLPSMNEGDEVSVKKIRPEGEFTEPPPRYNPSSLLRKMDQENVGTKATRAGILQTLYERKYIHGERITVTELGFEVTDVLRKYCPSIASVEFTRRLEEKMSEIQQGKENKSGVIAEAVEILKPVIASLKENEKPIGEKLFRAGRQATLEERIIGECPTCHSGKLIITHSKRTGKRFVGCSNYFKGTCKTAFPLPQRGFVKPTNKSCKECGWMTVLVWPKGKRPWNLCLNPQCSQKRRSIKK